ISGSSAFNIIFSSIQATNLTLNAAANSTNGHKPRSEPTIINDPTTTNPSGLELDAGRVLQNNATLTWTGGNINLNNNVNGTTLEIGRASCRKECGTRRSRCDGTRKKIESTYEYAETDKTEVIIKADHSLN